MTQEREFVFNLGKARQTIIIFIVSSLILISLLIFTSNKLSRNFFEYLEWLALAGTLYIALVVVFLKRLFLSFKGNIPKIFINDNEILIPTFYLGSKRILINKITSIEHVRVLSKDVYILLGMKGKGSYPIDKYRFVSESEFNDFIAVLEKIFESSANEESREIIESVSLTKMKKVVIATTVISLICAAIYSFSSSWSVEYTDDFEFVLQGGGSVAILQDGEIYRLFSAPFLHANLFHLLINIGSLAILGELFERIISSIRFANIFLITAIFAVFPFLLFANSFTGVGASGGIFGICGAYVYLRYKYEKYLPGSLSAVPLTRLLLVLSLELLAEIFFLDNIGFYSHIGGFIAGFAYLSLVPLGPKLETVDHPTLFEKSLFAVLVSAYTIGLSYFLLLYYGVI